MARLLAIGGALFAVLFAWVYQGVNHRFSVLGLTRSASSLSNIHGRELRIIPDTIQCEDLHLHTSAGLLFTACQGESASRFSYFPPMTNWKDPQTASQKQGSIYIINPKDFTSKRLTLKGFEGSFTTHGIDIWSSEEDPETVFIYAVNHVPNLEYYQKLAAGTLTSQDYKTVSQIEIFKHTISSSEATHLKTIVHPLIRTPNDILATSATTFYVTNDHYYREGIARGFEEFGFQRLAAWTDIVHVTWKPLEKAVQGEEVIVEVAHKGIHNNNGLGRGKNANELLIASASSGVLRIAERWNGQIPFTIRETIQMDTTIDNPFYFHDIYSKIDHDASGYVLAGQTRAHELATTHLEHDALDPVIVWLVQPDPKASGGWKKTAIFQDDGKIMRTASQAVIISIDPSTNGGLKQGWLFVTGFLSESMIATKIDL